MGNFYKRIKYICLLLVFIFCSTAFVLGQTKELDIYDEWFCTDSKLRSERPYFIIRNYEDFFEFWSKTEFGGIAPYIDFSKYMVFVWAPGSTKRDLSKVIFERLVYKEGCLLVLIDFAEEYKYYGSTKRPVKAAILPIFPQGDVFVFKKIKKAWQVYEWKPVFAIWDMKNERNRPFKYVLMDRQERPVYQLATASFEVALSSGSEKRNIAEPARVEVSQAKPSAPYTKPVEITLPRQGAVSKPAEVKPSPPSTSSQGSARTTTQRPRVEVSNAPISIGNEPPAKIDPEIKPEVAPGMGEDPLFGSEFDITF